MKQPTVYQSVVYQEGKYYVAQCLNVDVSSFGDTANEALKNLQEAFELYIEDAPRTTYLKSLVPLSTPSVSSMPKLLSSKEIIRIIGQRQSELDEDLFTGQRRK